MAVCLRSFFVRQRLLVSENDLYELANMFCHVGPDSLSRGLANMFCHVGPSQFENISQNSDDQQGWQYGRERSEFTYNVPRALNRTVPAHRTCTITKKRIVPPYRTS